MKKVIILKGLPASGKSTYAKRLLDENPGCYKRINKDDIRAMLDNSKWSKDNEKFVLKVRDHLIMAALEEGKHIIVDDTNLAPKHEACIRQLVKGKATVEVVEFDVTPEECIKRDLARSNSVGSDVIWRMYNQFLKPETAVYLPDTTLPDAVIFDVDGTLAHMKGRSPYDWDKVMEDEVDPSIAFILKTFKAYSHYRILILTGRDGSCEQLTKDWLMRHAIAYDDFFIRQAGDNRKDSVVKEEIFFRDIAPKYNVKMVFDDRNQVVEMWRSLGLKCLQVADGNF